MYQVVGWHGDDPGLQSPSGVAGDRLRDLLGLVLEQNPFQSRRVKQLDLGDDPALADLPPLTKLELVQDQERNPPFGTNLTYPLERYTELHQTSGTTGPPLRVLDTAEDWAWWRERFAHTLTVAGVGEEDRVALTYSFGPHVQFWAAKEGLEEVGAMSIALGGMGSVATAPDDRRGRGDGDLVHAHLRAAAARGRGGAAAGARRWSRSAG